MRQKEGEGVSSVVRRGQGKNGTEKESPRKFRIKNISEKKETRDKIDSCTMIYIHDEIHGLRACLSDNPYGLCLHVTEDCRHAVRI